VSTDGTSTCLVTGGAGFIGCALAPLLLEEFDRVVALDSLHPQVHAGSVRPDALDDRVELVVGDVTSAETWDDLLVSVRPSAVIHLAAETGTAQSLTEATRHSMVNVVGTTQMLDALVRHEALPESIVLTSSRAVYGEGEWVDADGATSYPGQRTVSMLEAAQWDFAGLTVLPFEASRTTPHPTSVYGATKLAQENVLTSWCRAVDVTPVVLRLQNVYGPGQSLTNPYTGIVSLFARLARAGEVIPVYEDGRIIRDFVYIDDVAAAIMAALAAGASDRVFDVGSGQGTSIMRLAEVIAAHYGAPAPAVNGKFRNGDVRAASSDITATSGRLGWVPEVLVDEGVVRLCDWVDGELSPAHAQGGADDV
jgi:dTDP-L-rhamnose 4-epimerase